MKQKAILGIIAALVIITSYVAAKSYDCLVLRFVSLPKELTDDLSSQNSAIVLLYGKNLCGTCPAGKFMYGISKDPNTTYLVPNDYSFYDIENLRYAFDINGKIFSSGGEIEHLLRRISRCKKVKNLSGNFYLQLRNGNKIKKIDVF
jgi:hypothetical protein